MREVINFSVGNHRISVEILSILMTEKFEKEPTQVPSEDDTLMGVLNYQGVSIPVYDLSLVLDGISARQRLDELTELLRLREQDHVDWLQALEQSIRDGTEFTGARDPHKCAFGVWYDSFSSENQDLMHLLRQFDRPHTEIHGMADTLLAMAAEQGRDAALEQLQRVSNTTLDTLRRLFQAAREALVSSFKPVVVYTTEDGRRPNVGFVVDAVDDTLSVEQGDIKLFSEQAGTQFAGQPGSSELITGMITKDGVNSLLINPGRLIRDAG